VWGDSHVALRTPRNDLREKTRNDGKKKTFGMSLRGFEKAAAILVEKQKKDIQIW